MYFMCVVICVISSDFIGNRLAKLRNEKGISARDMSFSLGQSQSYINNIENHKSMPSMQMFLYICEFLAVEPCDFFAEDTESPSTLQKASQEFKALSHEQLALLIAVAKEMRK